MFAKGYQMLAPVGDAVLTVAAFVAILAFLTIFGIWGFKLGSRGSDGNGGGGSKGPEPHPPPSPGGCEADDAGDQASAFDFVAWEEQFRAANDDAASRKNAPAGHP